MKDFRMSFLVTAVCVVAAFAWGLHGPMGGWTALWLMLVLAVLEVSLSFDNAVVNAGVLKDMDAYWRRMFLTVGMLIAVFGMRLVFPIVIVAVVADMGLSAVVSMALDRPEQYSAILQDGYPVIAAFGGMFLLLVFLNFLFDEGREIHWLGAFEQRLAKLGKLDNLAALTAMAALFVMCWFLPEQMQKEVLVAGMAGIMLHEAVSIVGSLFGGDEGESVANGVKRAGVAGFLYLEVLDASFSFDGVIGAFAITRDVVVIMLGLAVGAMFVRSMTIYLVNRGTLNEYVYLEHGAHYAIGFLALVMLAGTVYHVPEAATGLVGVAFILAALWTSVIRNRREALAEGAA